MTYEHVLTIASLHLTTEVLKTHSRDSIMVKTVETWCLCPCGVNDNPQWLVCFSLIQHEDISPHHKILKKVPENQYIKHFWSHIFLCSVCVCLCSEKGHMCIFAKPHVWVLLVGNSVNERSVRFDAQKCSPFRTNGYREVQETETTQIHYTKLHKCVCWTHCRSSLCLWLLPRKFPYWQEWTCSWICSRNHSLNSNACVILNTYGNISISKEDTWTCSNTCVTWTKHSHIPGGTVLSAARHIPGTE